MEIYGKPDKAVDGTIASQMPAWYWESQIKELREDIRLQSDALERGSVPSSEVPEAKALLARAKQQLDNILSSKPEVKDRERGMLQKYYKLLGTKISESMFTRDDMLRGTADAHEEARRMKEPIIEIDKPLQTLATSCNVKVTRGMVTRDGASKIFKIAGKLIGEPTNVENLRRDSNAAPQPVAATA